MYLNAQSIVGKIDELAVIAGEEDPDLILVTESWCNDDIPDAFLTLQGYSLHVRSDRLDTAAGRGGGLLVYVKDGISILSVDKLVDMHQYCVFTIFDLTVYLVYRSPNAGQESYDKLSDLVRQAGNNSIIIGDLNLPDVRWSDGEARGRSGVVLEAATEAMMEQLVEFPTHIRGNILDVILTYVPERIFDVEDVGRLGKSDHCMISAKVCIVNKEPAKQVPRQNWAKANWASMEHDLGRVDWARKFHGIGAEEAWNILQEKIKNTVQANVPVFRRRNADRPAWLSQTILREVRRKKRMWHKAKAGVDIDRYKEVERKVRNMIRQAKKKYEKKLSKGGNDGKARRKFFAYIKRRTKTRSSVGPFKTRDGATVDKDKDMAGILNSFFASTFTREPAGEPPVAAPKRFRSAATYVRFTPYRIKKKIRELKTFSAAGPDGICPQLLKNLQDVLAEPLASVMNKSMISGEVPADWKKANVTPLFKKGKRGDPGNYRPVSLTAVCCKLMEAIIKEDLVSHLERNKLIEKTQHGFVRGRSCTTNLIEYLNKLTAAVDGGTPVDVVYLDFAKAFDKVPTKRLLSKLHAHGVRGRLLAWIKNWLTGRLQRVILNGEFSDWMEVLSGVPQGSVLGPLLFIIFINDLDLEAATADLISKFADDTKVGVYIRGDGDRDRLQLVLNNLVAWADLWGMKFNVAKCKVVHFGPRNPKYSYEMNGVNLEESREEKDLGVIVTNKLSVSTQCVKAAKTANAVLGQISRAFHFRDKDIFTGLYKQYVRPHLEYAAQAWSPWLEKDKEVLEAVQKRAARLVSGINAQDYEGRLKELGWMTLTERRQRADMALMNGIMSERMDIVTSDWFVPAATGERSTRLNTGRLNVRQLFGRLEIRRNFYTVRTAKAWNDIPTEIKELKRHGQFKKTYAKWKDAQI